MEAFETVGEGNAVRKLTNLRNINHNSDTGSFTCRAWITIFTINEPVIQEYVWEFLATIDFEDHITSMMEKCLFFQLGWVRREMSMREFILAMGLYTRRQLDLEIFKEYYDICLRERPHNYNPAVYYQNIFGLAGYESKSLPSYRTIQDPIFRLVHKLLAVTVYARHSAREKMTVEDLFLRHGIDGGEFVDIPWYLARFMTGRAKGAQQSSMIQGAHFVGRLARSLGLMSQGALSLVHRTAEMSLIGITKLDEFGIITYNPLSEPILRPVMRRASGEGSSQAGGSQAGAED